MPVLCPSCGSVGLDADRTCLTCGTDLADDPVALVAADVAAPTARAADPETSRPGHRVRRRAVVVAITLAAVAAGAAATGAVLARRAAGPATHWAVLRVRVPVVAQPAGLEVVGLGARGQVRLADLATGRVRELRRGHESVRATTALTRGDVVVLRELDGRVDAVAGTASGAARLTDLGRADALVASTDPTRVWLARGSRVALVGTDGRTTTRATLPAGYRLTGGGLDDDALLLLATTSTDSIVWDPSEHTTVTAIGGTTTFAAAAGMIVTSACTPPVNRCHAVALDVRTPATRALDAPVWDGFESPVILARVAPDGSSVAFGEAFPGHHDVHAPMTLVDPRSGRVLWTHVLEQSASEPTAWDDRGDLLFFTDGVTAFVHHVDGPTGNLVSLGPARELVPVAVLPRRVGAGAGAARG
jgi:hypothetical protein